MPRGDVGGLDHVFGIGAIADHRQCHMHHRGAEPLVHQAQGVLVVGNQTIEDLVVAGRGAVGGAHRDCPARITPHPIGIHWAFHLAVSVGSIPAMRRDGRAPALRSAGATSSSIR